MANPNLYLTPCFTFNKMKPHQNMIEKILERLNARLNSFKDMKSLKSFRYQLQELIKNINDLIGILVSQVNLIEEKIYSGSNIKDHFDNVYENIANFVLKLEILILNFVTKCKDKTTSYDHTNDSHIISMGCVNFEIKTLDLFGNEQPCNENKSKQFDKDFRYIKGENTLGDVDSILIHAWYESTSYCMIFSYNSPLITNESSILEKDLYLSETDTSLSDNDIAVNLPNITNIKDTDKNVNENIARKETKNNYKNFKNKSQPIQMEEALKTGNQAEVPEFFCNYCNKRFKKAKYLARHRKESCNSGSKNFPCQKCGSGFNRKETLEAHRRRHTGEKPYKCMECGRLFRQIEARSRHMKGHLKIKDR